MHDKAQPPKVFNYKCLNVVHCLEKKNSHEVMKNYSGQTQYIIERKSQVETSTENLKQLHITLMHSDAILAVYFKFGDIIQVPTVAHLPFCHSLNLQCL